jgi:glycosyltransferase involved in cell wall biosynthesis
LPKSRPFRIAMIPTANGGVNYYRLASLAWQMRKKNNVEVAVFAFQYGMNETHPWQRDIVTNPLVRRQIESLCQVADIVIWQPVFYQHTLDFFLEMRAKYEKPMFVETDDDYIDVPPWNEAFHSFGPNTGVRQNCIDHLRAADGLIVSTPFLKETYLQFNQNIHVVENSLDFQAWDKCSVDKHKYIRIGWIGGRTHVQDLLMVAPVIKELVAEFPNVWFYVVNSALKYYARSISEPYVFEKTQNVYYTDKGVTINLYPRFMSHFKFDIGVAPLIDCNFNRAKSNLRWLEYSALKIPTVATKISHFEQTITPRHDGLLVPDNDLQVWKNNLKTLITDEAERRKIGRNAYATVKKKFNVRKRASEYLRILKDAAGYGQGAGWGSNEFNDDLHDGRVFDERPEPRPLFYGTN